MIRRQRSDSSWCMKNVVVVETSVLLGLPIVKAEERESKVLVLKALKS